MSDLKPGIDFMLAHTPGLDFPSQPPRVWHLHHLATRVDRDVTIANGYEPEGKMVWFVSAKDPSSGDLMLAWCYDVRQVQTIVEQMQKCIDTAPEKPGA